MSNTDMDKVTCPKGYDVCFSFFQDSNIIMRGCDVLRKGVDDGCRLADNISQLRCQCSEDLCNTVEMVYGDNNNHSEQEKFTYRVDDEL